MVPLDPTVPEVVVAATETEDVAEVVVAEATDMNATIVIEIDLTVAANLIKSPYPPLSSPSSTLYLGITALLLFL